MRGTKRWAEGQSKRLPKWIETSRPCPRTSSLSYHYAPRTFSGLRAFLRTYLGEGLVFHRGNETGDMAKIRRVDFGFKWPISIEEHLAERRLYGGDDERVIP